MRISLTVSINLCVPQGTLAMILSTIVCYNILSYKIIYLATLTQNSYDLSMRWNKALKSEIFAMEFFKVT